MMETKETPKPAPDEAAQHPAGPEEPGLLENVGTFPCWMLKMIQAVTPDFLISKEPPKKNYRI